MTYRCIQKIQLILHTQLFNVCTGSGVHFCSCPAKFYIDIIYIFHQSDGFFFSDILIKCTTEAVRNIIFSVRERSCSAKSAHDRTGLTVDTAFHLFAINRTFSFFQRISRFKNCHFQFRGFLHQLIRCKNSSRSCSDNNYVIFIHISDPPFCE